LHTRHNSKIIRRKSKKNMALWQTESKAKNLPVYLFEENVGKLVQDPKTNIVKPGSLDKGKLRVFRSRDDALIHLTWEATFTKNKTPQDSEDFIIFEGDCQAKLIPNKPGRVFFLKFQGNDSKKIILVPKRRSIKGR